MSVEFQGPREAQASRSPLRSLIEHRRTIGLFTRQDLKSFYGRYKMGLLWTMADPFAQAMFMWFVFAFIFGSTRGITVDPFVLYLVTGLIPLAWLNGSTSGGTKVFRRNAVGVATSALPEIVWPLRIVLTGLADYVLALPVIVLFAVFFHIFTGLPELTWGLVFFPLGILLQFFLCMGLVLIGASLAVVFPDVDRLTGLLNRFFFWMSPVIWSQKNFPDWLQPWLYLNPFHGILDFYRAAFWPELLSEPRAYVLTTLVIAGIFATGLLMFRRRLARIRRSV